MKLAEALLLRSDLQKRIESLRARLVRNCIVQEGEEPSEDPDELLRQIRSAIDELQRVVFVINTVNFTAATETGRTLTEALAERDAVTLQHSIVSAAAAAAVKPPDRYGLKEIRWVKTVDVPELQSVSDRLARRLREINAEIQAANWVIEVEDDRLA